MVRFKYNYKNWMHSFEVSLGYESVDRTTFSTWSEVVFHWKCIPVNAFIALHVENVVRSTLSYPNETSKECIQFLNKKNHMHCKVTCILYKKQEHFSQLFCLQVRSVTPWQSHDRKSRCLRGSRHSSILYSPSGFFSSYFINEVNF